MPQSIPQSPLAFSFASLALQVSGVAVQVGGTTYLMLPDEPTLHVIPDPQTLLDLGPVDPGIVPYLTEQVYVRLAQQAGGTR